MSAGKLQARARAAPLSANCLPVNASGLGELLARLRRNLHG